MSTTLSGPPALKKISSWVRPGVREMRARFLRPVSALIRLDLPTLERPASAISTPRIGGSETADPAAAVNCHSPANRRRPVSISSRVNLPIGAIINEIASETGPPASAKKHCPAMLNNVLEEHQACGFFLPN